MAPTDEAEKSPISYTHFQIETTPTKEKRRPNREHRCGAGQKPSEVFSSWVFLETQRLIQEFPNLVQKLWNYWELRVLVIVSLTLQLSLLLLGSRRRYSVETWIRIIIWFSYLGADSVATIALGVISNNQGNYCDGNDCQIQNELTTFWAPFLLLHLGGQDIVIAYVVQVNELWLRHLLGLIFQLGVALYTFHSSWNGNWLSMLTKKPKAHWS
ncbi:hypothetical protein ACB092_01G211400 [Castanea dentata]